MSLSSSPAARVVQFFLFTTPLLGEPSAVVCGGRLFGGLVRCPRKRRRGEKRAGRGCCRPFRHARYLKCGAFRRPEIRPEMFQGLPERQRTRGFREDGEWLFQLNTPPGGNFPGTREGDRLRVQRQRGANNVEPPGGLHRQEAAKPPPSTTSPFSSLFPSLTAHARSPPSTTRPSSSEAHSSYLQLPEASRPHEPLPGDERFVHRDLDYLISFPLAPDAASVDYVNICASTTVWSFAPAARIHARPADSQLSTRPTASPASALRTPSDRRPDAPYTRISHGHRSRASLLARPPPLRPL